MNNTTSLTNTSELPTLSLFLLQCIGKQIDNVPDKVCFYMTCKSLLKNRDQILRSELGFDYSSKNNTFDLRDIIRAQHSVQKPILFFQDECVLEILGIVKELRIIIEQFVDVIPSIKALLEIIFCTVSLSTTTTAKPFPMLEELRIEFNYNIDTDKGNVDIQELDRIMIPNGSVPEGIKRMTIVLNDEFNYDDIPFDGMIGMGSIPSSVECLTIDYRIIKNSITQVIPETLEQECILAPGMIPSSVTDLDFNKIKLNSLPPGCIPSSVKSLKFSSIFVQTNQISIPDSVEHVSFYIPFNVNLRPGLIPNQAQSVYYHARNNIHSNAIPSSVRKLSIDAINIPSELVFPPGLTHLDIPKLWSPTHQLPSTLVHLNCCLFSILKGTLPPTLKSLVLQRELLTIEPNSIPESVTTIIFVLPLRFELTQNHLPPTLTHLEFNKGIKSVTFPFIPSTVKTLGLGGSIENQPPKIPIKSLTVETLNLEYLDQLNHFLPFEPLLSNTIRHITFTQTLYGPLDSNNHFINFISNLLMSTQQQLTIIVNENESDRVSFYLTCKQLFSQREVVSKQVLLDYNLFELIGETMDPPSQPRKKKTNHIFIKSKKTLVIQTDFYMYLGLEQEDDFEDDEHYSNDDGPPPQEEEEDFENVVEEEEEEKPNIIDLKQVFSTHPKLEFINNIEITVTTVSLEYNLPTFLKVINESPLMKLEKFKIQYELMGQVSNLDHIKIPTGVFQSSIRELIILVNWDENCPFQEILQVGSIPDGLNRLLIDHRLVRHNPLQLIPTSVKDLLFYYWDSAEGEINMVPPTVSELSIIKYNGLNNAENNDQCVFSPGCFPLHGSLNYLRLSHIGNRALVKGVIPDTVRILELSTTVKDQPFVPGVIPDSVTDLTFSSPFNHDLVPSIIPPSVTSLSLHSYYINKIEKGSIPESVTKLNIKSLAPYGQKLDFLPLSLTHLEDSSKEILKQFPPTLTYIDCFFESILKDLLPSTLKTLIIRGNIQKIDVGSIPESVTTLIFYEIVRAPLVQGVLPSNVENIEFLSGISSSIKQPVYPPSIKRLAIGGCLSSNNLKITSLPNSLESLVLEGRFKSQEFTTGVLPPNLKGLEIKTLAEIPLNIETSFNKSSIHQTKFILLESTSNNH
eukprot:gene8458-10389_t